MVRGVKLACGPCGFLFGRTRIVDISESEDHGQGKLSLASGVELAEGVACEAFTKYCGGLILWLVSSEKMS